MRNGEILGIFPEATTGPALRKPKKGVTYLSLKSDCKILPMSVVGLDKDIWHKWFKGIRPQVKVKVGIPFSISRDLPSDRINRQNQLAEIGDDIMRNIAALLPRKFHGEYANDTK